MHSSCSEQLLQLQDSMTVGRDQQAEPLLEGVPVIDAGGFLQQVSHVTATDLDSSSWLVIVGDSAPQHQGGEVLFPIWKGIFHPSPMLPWLLLCVLV